MTTPPVLLTAIAVIGLSTILETPARAYQSKTVDDGGAVSGTVTLGGDPKRPGQAVFPKALAAPDRALCSTKRPLITPFYVVGAKRGLANVVVWLEGIKAGKPLARDEGVMVNENCRFLPHVQSLDIGSKVRIENQDPILHNTHAIYRDQKITAFNIGMPRKGQIARKRVRRPGVLRVQCDSGHTWMRAWIHVFAHPYHTVTDDRGRFEIKDIPPGQYTLHFWHERSGRQSKTITVDAAKTIAETAQFEARPLPPGHTQGLD